MSSSAARVEANRRNAQLSTGPRTSEGKERSRRNSLKHGLTGEGVALPSEDVAEVEERFQSFREEFRPSSGFGEALVRRAAIQSVRLDRCVSHETASISTRIRQVEADFVAPEGVDASTAAQLKAEAKALVLFDPSKEATLARRYEAAAERGLFRAIKELRQVEAEAATHAATEEAESLNQAMGSLFQLEKRVDQFEARQASRPEIAAPIPSRRLESAILPPYGGGVDVPITIGRRQ